MGDSKKSVGHISKAQKTKLLEILSENPQLRSGKFSDSFTMKDAQQQWEEIGVILNAIPGSNKTWKLWRKTWQDLSSKAKIKKAAFEKSRRGTGGGPPPDPLDDFEEDMVSLIHPNSIVGHEGVEESLVVFEDTTSNIPPPQYNAPPPIDILPPPPEFDNTTDTTMDTNILNAATTSNTQRETHSSERRAASRKTKKVNMKTLLKEKVELKKKLVEAKLKFYEDYIEVQRERNEILKNILNQSVTDIPPPELLD